MGNSDREECVRIVHRALEQGITSINTADGYSAGQSKEIIGEALTGGRRDEVVLSVKTGVVLDGHPNHGGGSSRRRGPLVIRQSAASSSARARWSSSTATYRQTALT